MKIKRDVFTALRVAHNASFFFTKASSCLMHLCHPTTRINIRFLHLFQVGLLRQDLRQYWLPFADFSLGLQ